MTDTLKSKNEDNVSPRLKAAVISITILTSIAGVIFFALFFQRMYSSFEKNPLSSQLLLVAEKLKSEGLYEQAIRNYQRFLDKGKPDIKVRTQVLIKLADLYRMQNSCAETISWLYEAELANPKGFAQNEDAKYMLRECKKKLTEK